MGSQVRIAAGRANYSNERNFFGFRILHIKCVSSVVNPMDRFFPRDLPPLPTFKATDVGDVLMGTKKMGLGNTSNWGLYWHTVAWR